MDQFIRRAQSVDNTPSDLNSEYSVKRRVQLSPTLHQPSKLKSNFVCLSIKIVKLAFNVLDMDFCLRVSATMIALPKNHPSKERFVLIAC